MNKNMSSIGFKTIEKKKKLISDIVKRITKTPDNCLSHRNKDGNISVEQYGYTGEDFGLVVYGMRQDNDEVRVRRWNTFAVSESCIEINSIQFSRMPSGDVFAFCEDNKTGHEFEFRLNNLAEYNEFLSTTKTNTLNKAEANIAGLCQVGSILFPVAKGDNYFKNRDAEIKMRKELISKFKSGDEAAEKKLFNHTIEMAENVRERLKTEDVLSVFEGYLLPYGDTDGTYAMLGDITAIKKTANTITKELVYSIYLDVTGVTLNIIVNGSDLVGLPMEGMRFMGICDLQGSINFKLD